VRRTIVLSTISVTALGIIAVYVITVARINLERGPKSLVGSEQVTRNLPLVTTADSEPHILASYRFFILMVISPILHSTT
jgi:hypothetical protein